MKYVQTFESFMEDAISEENTFFNENELSEEMETLENEIAALESDLSKRVIGQAEAIKKLSRAR
jgi:ATP-dependent Clp protease ATP-binding subunit ClpA